MQVRSSDTETKTRNPVTVVGAASESRRPPRSCANIDDFPIVIETIREVLNDVLDLKVSRVFSMT
jgi:hypothetical protein